jgi:predicted kinase
VTAIVVSGIPGSGKTTLAAAIAAGLRVPWISKDVIKEALMDELGTGDLAWVDRLSRASHLAMYDLARHMATDVVLEAHFHRGVAEDDLVALGVPLVQVHCSCPVEVAWERYRRRRDHPDRHPGHLPEHQDDAATAGWRAIEPRPLDLDAPLVVVGTAEPVDVPSVLARVVEALARTR